MAAKRKGRKFMRGTERCEFAHYAAKCPGNTYGTAAEKRELALRETRASVHQVEACRSIRLLCAITWEGGGRYWI